ncbi:hypothetical protein CRYUN_Cryun12cG0100800 [Craigia yunnanensis]
MEERDLVSWNSLICGYSKCKRFKELLGLFRAMQEANVKAVAVTMLKVILACCYTDNMNLAYSMVKYIEENCVHIYVYLGNTLIDIFSKITVASMLSACANLGALNVGQAVHDYICNHGLAVNGFADSALEFFSQMLKEVSSEFCLHVLTLDCRSGYLERAYQFIKNMLIHPDVVVWRILLSACKLHGNVVLVEIVTNNLLELDPSNSGNYVLFSNTYASSDRWHAATKMIELMEGNNVQKPTGWINIKYF